VAYEPRRGGRLRTTVACLAFNGFGGPEAAGCTDTPAPARRAGASGVELVALRDGQANPVLVRLREVDSLRQTLGIAA
jgi:hypothetical protein